MSNDKLTIEKFMTPMPHTIGFDITIDKAEHMMTQQRIKHLPVLKGGQLVGIVTDRDIQLLKTFPDVKADRVKVEEAFTEGPYQVTKETPLKIVVKEMAQRHYSSALVVDEKEKLVGIFTWVDALRAMSELI